jgi:hypothetical protein
MLCASYPSSVLLCRGAMRTGGDARVTPSLKVFFVLKLTFRPLERPKTAGVA